MICNRKRIKVTVNLKVANVTENLVTNLVTLKSYTVNNIISSTYKQM